LPRNLPGFAKEIWIFFEPNPFNADSHRFASGKRLVKGQSAKAILPKFSRYGRLAYFYSE
jgi:hypothetical protein